MSNYIQDSYNVIEFIINTLFINKKMFVFFKLSLV